MAPEQEPPLQLPELAERLLDLVDIIPPGRVSTYGDIGEMLGGVGARQVGSLMANFGAMTTWWRVVRADGTLPAGLHEQAMLRWRDEGTAMRGERLAMDQARWDGGVDVDVGGKVGGDVGGPWSDGSR